MEKLTLEQLAPYLPYKLLLQQIEKGTFNNSPNIIKTVEWKHNNIDIVFNKRYRIISTKPILRPLSDLTKIYLKEFYQLTNIDLELIDCNEWIEELIHMIKANDKFQLRQFNLLFKWHFDVFGLIDKGLAVDINKID